MLSCSAFGQAFTFSDIPFLSQSGSDWSRRVILNGGPNPSANTVNCMETLRKALIAQGITNKIYSLCVFVPDSVIAAATPLFLHKGYPMWTNNFVIGDLNVNGLKGNAIDKFMDSGVLPNNTGIATNGTGSRGMTVVVSETSSNNAAAFMGFQEGGSGSVLVNLAVAADGDLEWIPTDLNAAFNVETNDIARTGWISGNVVVEGGTTNTTVFVASPLETHKILITEVRVARGTDTASNTTITVFASRNASTPTSFNAQRLSFAMLHDGLTQTESSNVWWAVKTCRECLGGGSGDPVHNWANKVVVGGGAAVSTTSSNALRTFYSGLNTDSLLYRLVVVNPYAPDNLTAARTPVHWKSGHMIWTNVAFGESNLTVNGLAGNLTTKYLGTGLNPVAINYGGFSSISAGMTIQTFNIPASASLHDFAVNGTAANSLFSMANNSGTLNFYCWKFITVNTEFLARAAPSTTWAGYLSGNRTAANAIRLDWVTNGVHNIATNGTGVQTGSTASMTNMYAHANSQPGLVPASFSDHTISFIALHPGLTQTESSNLWVRVNAMRTAFGGGNP